jgi:HEAT repeat protein
VSRPRRLAANLGLSVAVTLVFLGALEGVARLFDARRPAPPPVADYIWDWSEKMPGDFYTMKSEAVGWPPWEEFNRDGLRDRTRPEEKPAGFWRVAVLGDSVTLGAETRPYEAYPQVLEARLRGAGRRIEVMNVALWGWSTRQERIAYERIARRYRPDQVLLAVCLNDIPELQNNLARPPRWLTALHERSALARRIVNAQGREIDSVERLFEERGAPRVREAMARFFEEVRRLRAEVEKDGAGFGMLVLPFRFQVEPGAPAPSVQEEIAAFCRSESLPCLDLLPALARVGPSAFVDYDHLSPSGASLTADTILGSGLLPAGHSDRDVLRKRFGDRPTTVPVLVAALDDRDPEVRSAAAWALGTLGPPGRSGALGAAAEPAVPGLAGALRDEQEAVRTAAAGALGALGPLARSVAPVLFAALDDPRANVRAAAAQALARLELTAESVSSLAKALGNRDGYVRAFAAWSLGNLGPDAREAVPALVEALGPDDTANVVAAALARIGPAAAQAVPALVADLRGPDAGRRWRAARTLGRIGPLAESAVAELMAALRDPNEAVRAHAARALGRIGPGAKPAAADLQLATGDSDPAVRAEARQALERLAR